MRSTLRTLAAALTLGGSITIAGTTRVVHAEGLKYPGIFEYFPDCTTAEEEFCVDRLEYTPTDGSMRQIIDAVVPQWEMHSGTDPHVAIFFHKTYTGPSSVQPMNSMSLNINMAMGPDSQHILRPERPTINGIGEGTYRMVLRLGDYDPSALVLTGRFGSYSLSRDAEGHYIADLTVRPTPLAMVLGESETSHIAIDTCDANQWVTDCEANLASRNEIMGAFLMAGNAEYRDLMRGMWMAGNGSTLQMNPLGVTSGTIDATVKGPHYVPDDFGVEGLVKEGDRYLNPAHFEMGIPLSMIATVLSTKMGKTVTVDMVKAFLANPSSMLSGTVEEVPAGAAAAVEKMQTLTTSVEGETLRVNFNLTHFSAPNPTLTINAPTTAGPGTTPTPSVTKKKLSNGATLSVAKKATKGKTISSKSLLSPSSGAAITKLVSKSTTVCKVTGTKVKMLKKGTCKLSVTVKKGKKSAAASVNVPVT